MGLSKVTAHISPQSPPPVARTFELFPKLPIELRLMVWRFTQPQRYLKLVGGNWPLYDEIGCYIKAPLRIVNAVCRESRSVALDDYIFLKRKISHLRRSDFWFNQYGDVIYITGRYEVGHILAWRYYVQDLRMAGNVITKLLVDIDTLAFHDYDTRWTDTAKLLGSMDEVVFVLGTAPEEKTKVITPGNIRIGGHLWARRDPATAQTAYVRLRTIMSEMKVVADEREGGNIPVVKVMVMAST